MIKAQSRPIPRFFSAVLAPHARTASLPYRMGRAVILATVVFIALGVAVQTVFPLVVAQTQMPPLFEEPSDARP